MAPQHRLRAKAQPRHVERALDVSDELHGVEVDTVAGELGQRVEALLQWAQRQNILDFRRAGVRVNRRHDVRSLAHDEVAAARSSAESPEVLIGSNRVSPLPASGSAVSSVSFAVST